MRAFTLRRCAFGLSGPALLLAGCGALPLSSSKGQDYIQPPIGARPNSCYAWMDATDKKNDLLYVTNYEGQDVTVYGWRTGKQLGTISCFYQPMGLCVDRRQDVYVVDFDSGNITEFAHGGTAPIKTLRDSAGYPMDCAVNRKTGDVAVVNDYGFLTNGSLLIYQHGGQHWTEYRSADMTSYIFDTYDDSGNLFVVGSGHARLVELRAGEKKLRSIALDQGFASPAGAHWDGRYLVVGDSTNTLYQYVVAGSHATLANKIPYNQNGRVGQFWFARFGPHDPQPKRLVAVASDTDQLFKFAYPALRAPLQEYVTGMAEPDGVALSRTRSSPSPSPQSPLIH